MLKITKPGDLIQIDDDNVRCLLQKRFLQQCGADFFIIEPADSIEDLEANTGCPIITSWFDGLTYGDADFAPCFEYVEEHRHCFEMVFLLNDDSSAVVLIIPKHSGVDATLLKLCSEFSNEVQDTEA